jgi:PAS domain S-box-containing protein
VDAPVPDFGPLEQVRQLLADLIDISVDGIIAADMKGTVIVFNRAAERLLGYGAEEVVGKFPVERFYPEGQARAIMRMLRDEAHGGAGKLSAQRITGITRTGEQVPITLCGALVYGEDGRELASVGIFYDLRGILRAQEELAESEAKFRHLYETHRHGLFFSSPEGKFLDCNDALVAILGYGSVEEILALQLPRDLYADPADRAHFRETVERDGFVKDYEVRFKKKNGDPVDVLLTAHARTDKAGKVLWYQGLIIDVTQRRRLERRLAESERLASLGKLAAGVAHEINNPLGGIYAYAHLVLEKTAADDPRRANLEKIVREAERAKETVQSLLRFARRDEPEFRPTDLNAVVRRVLATMREQGAMGRVEVRLALASALPRVMADANQLETVFRNVVLNAVEAMDGGGEIAVGSGTSPDARSVEVVFSDTGPGIADRDLPRIFEPFFTTKKDARRREGTGLGLAISHGIVEKHGGAIAVVSEVGRGTAFTVRLPIAEARRA